MSHADIHNTNTDRTMKGRPRPNTQRRRRPAKGNRGVVTGGLSLCVSVCVCVCVCLSVRLSLDLSSGLSGSNRNSCTSTSSVMFTPKPNQLGPRSVDTFMQY